MEPEYYEAFRKAKKQNYELIYRKPELDAIYNQNVKPMFEAVYEELLKQAKEQNADSIFVKHHLNYLAEQNQYFRTILIWKNTARRKSTSLLWTTWRV